MTDPNITPEQRKRRRRWIPIGKILYAVVGLLLVPLAIVIVQAYMDDRRDAEKEYAAHRHDLMSHITMRKSYPEAWSSYIRERGLAYACDDNYAELKDGRYLVTDIGKEFVGTICKSKLQNEVEKFINNPEIYTALYPKDLRYEAGCLEVIAQVILELSDGNDEIFRIVQDRRKHKPEGTIVETVVGTLAAWSNTMIPEDLSQLRLLP